MKTLSLYGVTSFQTYIYFTRSPTDKKLMKSLVRSTMLLPWVCSVLPTLVRFSCFGTHMLQASRRPDVVDLLLVRVLNTLRVSLITNAAYTYMVTDFMNLIGILKPTWCVIKQVLVFIESLTRLPRFQGDFRKLHC